MLDKIINYILVLILVATSGFQYFYAYQEWIAIGLVFTLAIVLLRRREVFLDYHFFMLISLFSIWEIIQFGFFGGFSFVSVVGTLSRFLLAYLIIVMLAKDFLPYFVNIITVLSLISLFFYALIHIPAVLNFMMDLSKTVFASPFNGGIEEYEHNSNIIIFNYHGYLYSPMRNSGPFWEPGAFSVFICLSLTFGLIIGRSLWSIESIVQIAALITTYSTSGYVVFFVIVFSSLMYKTRELGSGIQLLLKGIVIPLVLLGVVIFVQTQDFLLPKIENDILMAEETTSSRFGSALADIYQIQANPILGYGRSISAEFGASFFDMETMHRNSGVTRIVVQWGILSLLYYFLVIKSFKHVIKIHAPSRPITAALPFFVLFLSGFSQSIFQYPLFIGLMFLQFLPNEEEPLPAK
jgi:hypothetical protein